MDSLTSPAPAPLRPPVPAARRFARSLLLLALAGAGGVSVGLGVQALNGPVLERLAQVPAQAAITRTLAELTDTLARASTAAAYLERAEREDRRLTLSSTLRQQAQTIGILVGEVSVAGLPPDQTAPLQRMAVRLASDADELTHITGARLAGETALRQSQERLMERHTAFRGTLSGLIHEGIHMLQQPGGEEAGARLLTSRDELEVLDQSLMAALATASALPLTPAQLDEQEAIFQRDARAMMERINSLPISSASTRRSETTRFMLALGLDTGNIFDIQRDLSRLRTAAQAQAQSIRDRIDESSRIILHLIRRTNDGLARQTQQARSRLALLPPFAGGAAALALLVLLTRPRHAGPVAAPPPAPAPAEERPLRILLAEDEPINQMVCSAMLRRGGHTVTVTGDGAEALDAIRHAPPDARFDLAILDLRMPVMDGLGALRAIRALDDPALARLPVAILTASIIPEDADSCRAAGADMVLPKPLRPETIQPLLARLLNRAPASPAGTGKPEPPAAAGPADNGGFNDLAIRQMCDALPPGRVATLINGTLTALSDYGDTLRDAWGTGDLPRVSAMAHKIAGVAGVYGCLSLRAAAQSLEMAVERRDADPAPLLAALETALPAALARLGTERDRLAADAP
ncbi:CheY-like chemotaxis protein/HPt (histidine-containing phosphotransfer) domain-containing protein [Azospirillum fermentarium]|uniref:response regulator n=1 Tax=Azospirillum fermentarium TaxID=1233114 RepID=UPI0022273A4E|nr:response regulator [Azospirillum fermentarium]MCW2247354.1 CheY-like chemotaxis protein/HPt (histidine-containing phosphotransfer) domain-containing protein [Azospirillum fermentarium]